MKRIEKERKFLLKSIPDEIDEMDDTDNFKAFDIQQFYLDDGTRYRMTQDEDGELTYEKLKKRAISPGVNIEEDVEDITEEQYDDAFEYATKHICKTRHTFDYEGKTFELDVFDEVDFSILEVEGVNPGEDIVMPEWLKGEIVMEVTGMPAFNNYELASEVEKVEQEEDDDLPF